MSSELPQDFQYLVLFAALCGRAFSKSELGIGMKTKDIEGLAGETGLLHFAKKGNSLTLSANAQTLEWVGANLNVDLPGKNKAVLAIVHLIRAKTAAFLKARNITMSEFLQLDLAGAAAVKKAYLGMSGGAFGVRVLLKDLRKQLPMDREAQDAAFMEMIRSGDADFYPEDDPMSRNEEDDEAALSLADRRRHLVYLRR